MCKHKLNRNIYTKYIKSQCSKPIACISFYFSKHCVLIDNDTAILQYAFILFN